MQLTSQIIDALSKAIASFTDSQEISRAWVVEPTVNASFGDFTSNCAMQLFRSLPEDLKKAHANPRQFASVIVEQLKLDSDFMNAIEKIEVAGPGFINFTITPKRLNAEVSSILKSISAGACICDNNELSGQYKGQKILVEFTDPNPFKELHIGHAYSNIVGEAIAKMFEHAGAEVVRVCYQGDVGMHVAKSVWGMMKKLSDAHMTLPDLAAQSLAERIKFLGQSYAVGATVYEEDEIAKQDIKTINFITFAAAQQRMVEHEGWTPQVDYTQYLVDITLDVDYISELYQAGRAWSLAYFDEMYARLGVKYEDFFFESLVGEYGLKIVREFLAKGIFKESQGAIIFPGSEYGLHDRVFVNALGLPTYEAKELGLAPEKYRRYKYDFSIIITANEINEYFKVLLKAMEQTHPELAAKTKHMSHGMVKLPEGKMSSRTGNVITAPWLLDEAQSHVVTLMQETRPEWTQEEREQVAVPVSIGAVKYAFLKQAIGGDIAFSFTDSLSFAGQSGPYLQYTYVRCASILEKAKEAGIAVADVSLSGSTVEVLTAVPLIRLLVQYPLIVDTSIREFAPHHIALYAFELAQAFSIFYDQSPIMQEADAVKRDYMLAVVVSTMRVLKHALNLLGIETVERM